MFRRIVHYFQISFHKYLYSEEFFTISKLVSTNIWVQKNCSLFPNNSFHKYLSSEEIVEMAALPLEGASLIRACKLQNICAFLAKKYSFLNLHCKEGDFGQNLKVSYNWGVFDLHHSSSLWLAEQKSVIPWKSDRFDTSGSSVALFVAEISPTRFYLWRTADGGGIAF